jgi:hypothetical protein
MSFHVDELTVRRENKSWMQGNRGGSRHPSRLGGRGRRVINIDTRLLEHIPSTFRQGGVTCQFPSLVSCHLDLVVFPSSPATWRYAGMSGRNLI